MHTFPFILVINSYFSFLILGHNLIFSFLMVYVVLLMGFYFYVTGNVNIIAMRFSEGIIVPSCL